MHTGDLRWSVLILFYSAWLARSWQEKGRSSAQALSSNVMDFASSFSIDNILRNNPSSRNTSQVFNEQNGPRALTLAERLAGMWYFCSFIPEDNQQFVAFVFNVAAMKTAKKTTICKRPYKSKLE